MTNYAVRPIIPDQVKSLDNLDGKYREVQEVIAKTSKKPTDINIPVCYGYTQTEGIKLFDTIGSDNNVLEICYVLSEGPIGGLNGLSINGYQLDLKRMVGDKGHTTVQAGTIYDIPADEQNQTNAPFRGIFAFEFINGGQSTILQNNTNIGETIDLENVAYVVVRLTKVNSETIWEDDGDPTFGFRVLGKTVPPIGNKSGTLAYSNNPARIMYDYLTNGTYGKGLGDGFLDSTTFTAAETWFDTTANIIRFEPAMAQFQMDGIVDTSKPFKTNLQEMLDCFLCSLPYVNNKFHLIAEQPGSFPSDTAFTFTDDNVVGDVTIAFSGTKDKWNNLKLQIRDRNAFYSTQTYSFPTSSSVFSIYVTQDGQQRLERSINLPYVEMAHIGLNIGQIMTNKVRAKSTLSWKAKADSYQVRVGDFVEMTNSRANLSSQKIRITKTTFNLNDFTVSFEGFTHDNSYYTYDTDRLKFLYPVQRRPNLPGPVPPVEEPPVYNPPTTPNPPDTGEPGGPPGAPPDNGQPTPGQTFTYNFTSASPNTMDDNSQFYLGEFSYTNTTDGARTERFNATGSQCHLVDGDGNRKPKQIDNVIMIMLTAQISIFDRNFDPTKEPEKFYFVMEFSSGRYGLRVDRKTFWEYDPETDGSSWKQIRDTGTTNRDDWQQVKGGWEGLRLWPDGRGNYSTRFSPNGQVSPNVGTTFPRTSTVAQIPDLDFDPLMVESAVDQATFVDGSTVGIKVYKEGRFSQPNYVGEFTIDFGLANINSNEVVVDSRKLFRYMKSGGFPNGNPNDTSITPPF